MEQDYILQLKNITKIYGPVRALDDISFNIKRNKILSIVGENGAGKSTLLKIFSGVIPKSDYQGHLLLDGIETNFSSVNDSLTKGISIIHQELSISPFLSICENMYLNNYKKKFGILDWNAMLAESKKYLEMVGLRVDPSIIAGTLSVANQQLVEIAKALSKNTRLIFFDEPTSSLNDEDSFKLLDLMKHLRDDKNITSVFVSHKLEEVAYVADDIAVIRDGKFISSYDKNTKVIDDEQLIKDIVGRPLSGKFPPRPTNRKIGNTIFEARNIKVRNPHLQNAYTVKNAYFDVKEGEIIGLSGLVGSGRTELMLSIFGKYYNRIESGEVLLRGKKVIFENPKAAIVAGVMYASEDRKNIGLIQQFSIKNNINSASDHIYTRLGFYDIYREETGAQKLSKDIGVKTKNINNPVDSLSGGNQQKVVLAKALSTQFDVLIIDEPTKGIDVGSKYEIYELIFELATEGKAIIVISSELEELLGITDRIFVMSNGEIKGMLATSEATQEKIMQISLLKQKENNERQ